MKRLFLVFTLLIQVVMAEGALATTVNFGALGTNSYDILTANNPTGVTLDGVTFRYDDLGSGVDFASIDSTGIFGSTGGSLILDFSYPTTGLNFDFSIYGGTTSTTPLYAIFSNGDTLSVSAIDLGAYEYGTLTYSGTPFNEASFFFGSEEPYFNVYNVSYAPVPEPATFALLAAGLLGLGGWRLFGRKS